MPDITGIVTRPVVCVAEPMETLAHLVHSVHAIKDKGNLTLWKQRSVTTWAAYNSLESQMVDLMRSYHRLIAQIKVVLKTIFHHNPEFLRNYLILA